MSEEACGCGHPVSEHDEYGCTEWWRYPDVLNARPCGCKGVWQPDVSNPDPGAPSPQKPH